MIRQPATRSESPASYKAVITKMLGFLRSTQPTRNSFNHLLLKEINMQVSIILGHPDPSSFNHAIAHAARTELRRMGCRVVFHDLIAERFDPLLPTLEIPEEAVLPADIERHALELAEAEGLVIVHPNWWGMPPAILKGWVDRVFRCGVAYEFEEGDDGQGVPIRLLDRLKAAVVFNTGNTPPARELEVFGDPLERIWEGLHPGTLLPGRISSTLFHGGLRKHPGRTAALAGGSPPNDAPGFQRGRPITRAAQQISGDPDMKSDKTI